MIRSILKAVVLGWITKRIAGGGRRDQTPRRFGIASSAV